MEKSDLAKDLKTLYYNKGILKEILDKVSDSERNRYAKMFELDSYDSELVMFKILSSVTDDMIINSFALFKNKKVITKRDMNKIVKESSTCEQFIKFVSEYISNKNSSK